MASPRLEPAPAKLSRFARNRMPALRVRTRLLIILMVISGLGLTGMSVSVWGLTRDQMYERVDKDLRRSLTTWALSPEIRNSSPDTYLPSQFILMTAVPGQRTRIDNIDGCYPKLSELIFDRRPRTVSADCLFERGEEPRFRVIAVQAPDGTSTVVAKSLEHENGMLEALAAVLASISVLVLAIMGVAGVFFVRRALLPLKDLEYTALAIADGNVDCRAPAWPRDTEFGRLSYAMNTMVSQLQETLDESREKEEQMRRFVGDASHELRTPLTSVRGYTELYRAGATDDADMVLSKIDEESARMKLLVEDLLALTRAEGSRLNLREVDVLELVMSVSGSAQAAFPGRELSVDNDATDIPLVSGDPDRLHQVLLNLVSNAFKHAGDDAAVTITVREYLDNVYIDVADDGCGMAQEDADHIFERFYRADSSRNRSKSGGGSGLGLAITKSIVEQHGGAITVRSKLGEGSKFTVSLPRMRVGGAGGADSSAGEPEKA